MPENEVSMPEAATVYVRQGKAYVPVVGKTIGVGIYLDSEPVFVSDLSAEGLLSALEQALAYGNPPIPHPTQVEWATWHTPVLQAAKVKTWGQLAKCAAIYLISWYPKDNLTALAISHSMARGEWRYLHDKRLEFPIDVSLRELVNAILEDVSLHPELVTDCLKK
jgi:hypothetical protein